MKKIIIALVGIISFSLLHASEQEFSHFSGLPLDIQKEVIQKHLTNVTTVPELYRWKRINKEFKGIEYKLFKKVILEKEASILKKVSQQLSLRGYSKESNKLNLYILTLSPQTNKNFNAMVVETDAQTADRVKKLNDILGLILAQVALNPNHLDLMKLLVNNGANINYFDPKAQPEKDLIGIPTYAGITPLDSAIVGALSRIRPLWRSGAQLPDLSMELEKIEYLVSKKAQVNFGSQGQQTFGYLVMSYPGMLVNFMTTYNKERGYISEFNSFILEILRILLNADVKISQGVQEIAVIEKEERRRPQLYNLLDEYFKKRGQSWEVKKRTWAED